ncbi:MAG TPA: ABC transporter ATP-binding protein [Candidatus Saccharimonadales bacterium]|jgi:putative ABC transport system ATP-binding protein|nr:ABC transporter ATP-binding protein [Candidatus Saccharimonadales bacterium]
MINPTQNIPVKKSEHEADGKPPILIEVKNLIKEYKIASGTIRVLKDISFEVEQGSFTIIFGPSGSGKSTLMNVLSGLDSPTSGYIKIADQNIYELENDLLAHFRGNKMGIVHQENYWIKSLNVLENVAMPLYLAGSDKKAALQAATQSLEQVGLTEFANYMPTVLSGGQQQRVSMARALVAYPQLILTDEPTGNLDTENGQMIVDLLLKFQHDLKRTIVLVTHNIEYLPLSDNQLYILDGQVTKGKRGNKMPPEILASLKLELAELTKMEEGA